jgi:hypothetical protein
MCRNASKIESKFPKHHLFRIPHRPYSPDLSACDFSLFGMLKGILKDRELTSSDEIEEGIMKVCNELTFDDL